VKRLGKDDILKAADMRYEDVEVPEWDGTVRVKGLNGLERDQYEHSLYEFKGKDVMTKTDNARARLVSYACVDDEGNRLFSETDVAALGKKSGKALTRVFDVARRLAGLSKEDMEELTKNSETAQPDALPTA
jgi:hypothetical protein